MKITFLTADGLMCEGEIPKKIKSVERPLTYLPLSKPEFDERQKLLIRTRRYRLEGLDKTNGLPVYLEV